MKLLCCRCEGKGTVDETKLPKVQHRILNIVREARCGLTIHELVDEVYADDENGGPLYAVLSVQATIVQLNRWLKVSGVQIKATRKGRGALYKLVEMQETRTIFRRTPGEARELR